MYSRNLNGEQHKKAENCGPASPRKLCAQPNDGVKSLLFIHRDSISVQLKPSVSESGRIRQHLAQRYEKRRRSQKRVQVHPSVARIVQESLHEEKDMEDFYQDGNESTRKASSLLRSKHHALTKSFTSSMPNISIMNTINYGILDPFAPRPNMSADQKHLLFIYCKHLRPLALAVCEDWDWTGSLSQIQASPMLTSAISAYVSAFLTGLKQGARELALPPEPEKNRKHLWAIPLWFRFQTQSLEMLNQALLNRRDEDENEIFQTVLFLFRLAILMGDGIAGKMHFQALQRLLRIRGKQAQGLSRELAITQINIVTLYLYKDSLVKRRTREISEENPGYVIEPEWQKWTDEQEYCKFKAMLFGRFLTWQCHNPGATIHEEACRTILRVDPISTRLPEDMFTSLAKHYQIAVYVWSYLTNVVYDTSLPKIRFHTEELVQYLQHGQFSHLEQTAPKTVFFLLFIGAYASRGHVLRQWFTARLAQAKSKVFYMQELYDALDAFNDSGHVVPVLLEEILIDIRKASDCKALVRKKDLYRSQFDSPRQGSAPRSLSPDLETPMRDLQDQDNSYTAF